MNEFCVGMTSLNDDQPGEITAPSKSSTLASPSARTRVPLPAQMPVPGSALPPAPPAPPTPAPPVPAPPVPATVVPALPELCPPVPLPAVPVMPDPPATPVVLGASEPEEHPATAATPATSNEISTPSCKLRYRIVSSVRFVCKHRRQRHRCEGNTHPMASCTFLWARNLFAIRRHGRPKHVYPRLEKL